MINCLIQRWVSQVKSCPKIVQVKSYLIQNTAKSKWLDSPISGLIQEKNILDLLRSEKLWTKKYSKRISCLFSRKRRSNITEKPFFV